jgi:hypothetical protein
MSFAKVVPGRYGILLCTLVLEHNIVTYVCMDEPTTSKIILELADPLLVTGYTMYQDSWYTSPDVFDKLCQRTMECTGTMRLNKKAYQRSDGGETEER